MGNRADGLVAGLGHDVVETTVVVIVNATAGLKAFDDLVLDAGGDAEELRVNSDIDWPAVREEGRVLGRQRIGTRLRPVFDDAGCRHHREPFAHVSSRQSGRRSKLLDCARRHFREMSEQSGPMANRRHKHKCGIVEGAEHSSGECLGLVLVELGLRMKAFAAAVIEVILLMHWIGGGNQRSQR
jgi:hypothetical protein